MERRSQTRGAAARSAVCPGDAVLRFTSPAAYTMLGRTPQGYDPGAAFFTALRQDPVLAGVHLIAEPWDAAYDGYQLGRFPGRFLEWNDKFRDTVRAYWLGVGSGRASSRGASPHPATCSTMASVCPLPPSTSSPCTR